MPRVGFESTIPVFQRAKTVHALGGAATLIGSKFDMAGKINEPFRLLMIGKQTWLGQFNPDEITSPWNNFMRWWSRREILETGQEHSRDAKIFINGLTTTVQWYIPLNVFQLVFSWQNVGKQNFLHIPEPLNCNKRLLPTYDIIMQNSMWSMETYIFVYVLVQEHTMVPLQ
jgi:hypothetical protein